MLSYDETLMQTHAAKLSTHAKHLDAILDTSIRDARALRLRLSGQAADAYFLALADWDREVAEMKDTLQRVVAAVNKITSNFQETERTGIDSW